jgi:leucyl aminopeptidase
MIWSLPGLIGCGHWLVLLKQGGALYATRRYPVSPLLPPTSKPASKVAIRYRRGLPSEQQTHSFDAFVVLVGTEKKQTSLRALPNSAFWSQLSQQKPDAAHWSTRLNNSRATLMAVSFVKDTEKNTGLLKPFNCLTQAAKLLKEVGIEQCSNIALSTVGLSAEQEIIAIEALVAATLAAAAPMPSFKSKQAKRATLQSITLFTAHNDKRLPKIIDTTLATHAGNHLARWLAVLPPNELNCVRYARELRTLAAEHHWQYRFYNEATLKKLGAGAFLAVSRANAHRGAGIVKLSYRPANKKKQATQPIALVGKGICFDTGGINLKPHKSMYHMHGDMQGSSVAVGTLLALSMLKFPFPIDCWLALTENEIGPEAYRPQEVVTALNGVTIQVAHSDAEGRMALADTLALAARDKPSFILDFATLTGACVTALSDRMSGVFTNRSEWHSDLLNAGKTSGERVWPFPMDDDYDSDLDSTIADILQCTPDSKGDHILAARFLNRFVPNEIGWVHVDLAASERTGGLAHVPTEFTGFGVRFAVEWVSKKVMSEG